MLGAQIWGRSYQRDEDAILGGVGGAEDWNLTGRLAWTPNADHEVLAQMLDEARPKCPELREVVLFSSSQWDELTADPTDAA